MAPGHNARIRLRRLVVVFENSKDIFIFDDHEPAFILWKHFQKVCLIYCEFPFSAMSHLLQSPCMIWRPAPFLGCLRLTLHCRSRWKPWSTGLAKTSPAESSNPKNTSCRVTPPPLPHPAPARRGASVFAPETPVLPTLRRPERSGRTYCSGWESLFSVSEVSTPEWNRQAPS